MTFDSLSRKRLRRYRHAPLTALISVDGFDNNSGQVCHRPGSRICLALAVRQVLDCYAFVAEGALRKRGDNQSNDGLRVALPPKRLAVRNFSLSAPVYHTAPHCETLRGQRRGRARDVRQKKPILCVTQNRLYRTADQSDY